MNDGETDISDGSRQNKGDFMVMRKLERILSSFFGGALFLLGTLFIIAYAFSVTKPNEALILGLIFTILGGLFTYFLAYRPR